MSQQSTTKPLASLRCCSSLSLHILGIPFRALYRCSSIKKWCVCSLYFSDVVWTDKVEAQAPHIDRTDFLNVVVREKKRFENTLDECVAAGLNAGTQVLMNQVHTICIRSARAHMIPGRAHHHYTDQAARVLPTRKCAARAWAYAGLHGSCQVSRGALRAPPR